MSEGVLHGVDLRVLWARVQALAPEVWGVDLRRWTLRTGADVETVGFKLGWCNPRARTVSVRRRVAPDGRKLTTAESVCKTLIHEAAHAATLDRVSDHHGPRFVEAFAAMVVALGILSTDRAGLAASRGENRLERALVDALQANPALLRLLTTEASP